MKNYLLDTNILLSSHLRDMFMHMAKASFYTPFWSQEIIDEYLDVLRRRGLKRHERKKRAEILKAHFPHALLTKKVQFPDLEYKDPKDAHLIEVAAANCLDSVITFNIRDLKSLQPEFPSLQFLHPDVFLSRMFQQDPKKFEDLFSMLISNWDTPQIDRAIFINKFSQHLPEFTSLLQQSAP